MFNKAKFSGCRNHFWLKSNKFHLQRSLKVVTSSEKLAETESFFWTVCKKHERGMSASV